MLVACRGNTGNQHICATSLKILLFCNRNALNNDKHVYVNTAFLKT